MTFTNLTFAFLILVLSVTAKGDGLGINSYEDKLNVYVGVDWSAVSAERYKILNANASFANYRLGWEPATWLAFEHRNSFYNTDDEIIKFGLELRSEGVEGNYIKLMKKLGSLNGYVTVGKVTVKNSIVIPEFPEANIYDFIYGLVDPEGVLPDELRNTPPGRYHFDKSGTSYGIGFEGNLLGEYSKWKWLIEMEYIGNVEGWTWRNYYLGFKREF